MTTLTGNALWDTLFAPHEGSESIFLHLPDGRTISYAEFLGHSARLAGALRQAGLAPGDRVAVQAAKSADALALYAACVRTGLIYLPLNTGYTAAEVSYFVEDSAARILVCDPSSEETLAPVCEAAGARLLTLDAAGTGTLADLAIDAAAFPGAEPRTDDDLAAFLYTSGTTGRSKGAMLTHANLASNALTLREHWQFTEADTLLHALPIFHTHGLFVATNVTLAAGGAMVLMPKLDTAELVRWMPEATALMGVPTFYTRLLADPGFTAEVAGGMRLFISGSAPLLSETHRDFEARTGHRILERYGMTETNMSVSNPYEGARKPGTVGRPLPGVELRVVDRESGAPVPQGETGIVEVRGPNVFKGYWNMPEKTAAEFRPDGFFITGDLGRLDEDGYLTIVGRDKDLVISGGYNVYPKEIEEILDEMEGVLESAVIGCPDADLGEVPVAILVPSPGATPDLDAIAARLGETLARYKQPRGYEVVEELPRNTMGKVQKAELRRRFSASRGGEEAPR
ncbi:malonyl-CoA synthase [Roseicyclus sp. F158]|uniref:Malonyl-CoA synthase n=1 Tax=Tropicimonas omnivorans TaxID=3075590 RepID=A0ABU3DGV5_9RHOB|nr:malonyl-CoA synthase [Roseicyclus sp. F158]MDT0682924.1 malonyl-CoA synthase [Roseicyclus sp. F158]